MAQPLPWIPTLALTFGIGCSWGRRPKACPPVSPFRLSERHCNILRRRKCSRPPIQDSHSRTGHRCGPAPASRPIQLQERLGGSDGKLQLISFVRGGICHRPESAGGQRIRPSSRSGVVKTGPEGVLGSPRLSASLDDEAHSIKTRRVYLNRSPAPRGREVGNSGHLELCI